MMEHAIFDMIVRGSAALIIKKKSSKSDSHILLSSHCIDVIPTNFKQLVSPSW